MPEAGRSGSLRQGLIISAAVESQNPVPHTNPSRKSARRRFQPAFFRAWSLRSAMEGLRKGDP